jgi:ribosomal protein L37E
MSERDDWDEVGLLQQCRDCGNRQLIHNENDACESCGHADWRQPEMILE